MLPVHPYQTEMGLGQPQQFPYMQVMYPLQKSCKCYIEFSPQQWQGSETWLSENTPQHTQSVATYLQEVIVPTVELASGTGVEDHTLGVGQSPSVACTKAKSRPLRKGLF